MRKPRKQQQQWRPRLDLDHRVSRSGCTYYDVRLRERELVNVVATVGYSDC